jgi:Tfp pilus assembly protein PilN
MTDAVAKQQINLLDQGFRPKAVPLSAQFVVTMCVAVVVVLGLFYVVTKSQLPKLQAQAARLASEYDNQQQRLTSLSAQAGQKFDSTALDDEIARLMEEKKTKANVVNLLAGQSLGNTTGFSTYLEGLARQIHSGVWLREIVIHNGGSDMSIAGSTLDPKLVPKYLQRLSKESVFSGTEFNSFEMRRQEKQPVAVDFVIKTAGDKE